jgi:DNA modification methylase
VTDDHCNLRMPNVSALVFELLHNSTSRQDHAIRLHGCTNTRRQMVLETPEMACRAVFVQTNGICEGGPVSYRRKEQIGPHTLYLGDCMEVMPTLGRFDAVVTDPPYGIGEAAGRSKGRTSGLSCSLRGTSKYQVDYGDASWDNETCDDAVALAMKSSRHSIVFGGNYYDLPPTSCWLIWDKLNGSTDFADCELAWTNLPKAVRRLRFLWNGCLRRERHIPREHPTQKPVEVMRWCISHLPDTATTILDPFMGSGTTGVAAQKLGCVFTGIEQDERYFDIACRRIEEAMRQPDLFVDQAKAKDEQIDLLEAGQ